MDKNTRGKISEEQEEIKLTSTAPVCDKKRYGDYVEILHQRVLAPNIYNIGIIAPYGAGKSSLLETYKETKYNNSRKKITTISLANFNSSKDTFEETDKSSDNADKEEYKRHIQDIECSVERSILQQFIYKVKKSKLPHSRLDRIDTRHFWFSLIISITLIAAIALTGCGVLEFLNLLPYSQGNNFYYLFGTAVLSALLLLFFLIYSHRLNRISIKDIETEFCNERNTSVLNTFIDELIYYFSKTKVNIVIIEDLDRFNNTNLFAKLREINFLINNSDIVKQKVTFIYSVKDDLFKNENDRAKFFDFIISLVPILSFTNARESIQKEMEKLCPSYMLLPESYIYEISHFITEMRILKNVINDYIIYYRVLKLKTFSQSDKNVKLFSLILYKNLRPSDFADLQFGRGQLVEYFKEKDNKIDSETISLKEELNKLEERQKGAVGNKIKSFNNLKSLVKGLIIDHAESANSSYTELSSLNTFMRITNGLTFSIRYDSFYCSKNTIEKHLGHSLIDMEQNIIDGDEKSKNEISNEILDIREKIKNLTNYSMKEFLISNEKFIEDELISFFLANGYIAEDYKDFIAHNDQELLSSKDNEFVRNVLAKKAGEYSITLENSLNVIREIQPERFSDKYVLNYDLIKALLNYSGDKKDYIVKRNNVIRFLSSMDFQVKNFLENYLNDGQDISILVNKLKTIDITSEILKNENINNDIKSQFVVALLHNLNQEEIIKQNKDHVLENYLNNKNDVVDTVGSQNKELFKFIAVNLSLKIKSIQCKEENHDIVNFIVQNKCYEINYENLKFISCCLYSVDMQDFETAPLTSMLELDNEMFVAQIKDKIVSVLDLFINQEKEYSESQNTLEVILNNKTLSENTKQLFIEKQNIKYSYFDNIEKNILQFMFNNNKIIAQWDNVIKAKCSGSILLSNIVQYLNLNASELGADFLDNKEMILTLCNKIEYNNNLKGFSEFSKAFKIELKIQEIVKDNISSILVKNGIILSNETNLKNAINKPLSIAQLLTANPNLANMINVTSFNNNIIEQVFLFEGLPDVVKTKLLISAHYIPDTEEAISNVKDFLVRVQVGNCEIALLKKIIESGKAVKEECLTILSNNDWKLSQQEKFDLLKLVEPKLNNLQNLKEQNINVGELDNEILDYLSFKNLFKVTTYSRIIKLKKLF